jgi:hypothetical protein
MCNLIVYLARPSLSYPILFLLERIPITSRADKSGYDDVGSAIFAVSSLVTPVVLCLGLLKSLKRDRARVLNE